MCECIYVCPLNELSFLDGSTPIDLDEFRELLQGELENEDSRKAALQGLIEEIVAHPDYTMKIKYRIGKNDPIEPVSYPHESRYARGGPPLVGVSYSYSQIWKYTPPSRRI